MDTRLLKYYEQELSYLREMGAEFAESYPKVAARLGLEGVEVLDPYVERLLEGVAFLTARVQLEQDLQYPAFASHLLETVYPHYLGPTPSMMVAELNPDMDNAGLEAGYVLPRKTRLRSKAVEGAQSACIFETAHDLTLWPITVEDAEYIDSRGALVAAGVAVHPEVRAGIRLRLKRHGDGPMGELDIGALSFFLGGRAVPGWKLYEHVAADALAVVARSTDRRADWSVTLPGGLKPKGFAPDEALLPLPRPSFDGYRLLQEYFAMPERFHFVEISGLEPALARCNENDIDLYILLRNSEADMVAGVEADAFKLNCTPAINLYERRCDRSQITTQDYEQHVVVDRTAPLDYEVHSVVDVMGLGTESGSDVKFRPFYMADNRSEEAGQAPAFFTVARRMRQRTEREMLRGTRTNYLGSETFLSLVDGSQAPYGSDLKQLAVRAMVTNRDLPMMLAIGADDLFHLPDGGPVASIGLPVTPTRPRPSMAQGEAAWRMISHLSLNYLSIAETDGKGAAGALRELIGLYAPRGDPAIARLLEGMTSVSTRPIVRRMSDEVISTAVRGLEVTLEFDEDFFEGTSAYLLAAVLENFLRNFATINSFTETVLRTQQREEIARWRPKVGLGRII